MHADEDRNLSAMGWVLLRAAGDPSRSKLLTHSGNEGLVDALAEMLIGVLLNDLHRDPHEVMRMWQHQYLQRLTNQAKDHHDH